VPSNEMVYIVDDDARVVNALSCLLRANGKQVQIFTSGQDFLDLNRQDSCACLILDLRMPGLNGLQVQESIAAQTTIPVIFITGRGDVPSTVRAMKGGAMDFLTKPIDETALLACIERALERDRRLRLAASEQESLLARYRSLTPREQQVLPLLVRGLLNKQAAWELGITEYTVQIHRGISCEKWRPTHSQFSLSSPANLILSLTKHPRLHGMILYGSYLAEKRRFQWACRPARSRSLMMINELSSR
jgi:FixJ family two-component response regulator